ncbi:tryptophan-rich sensory protein [uncultured Dokdonia sp.]|uniref:tryptophan-rich sensory protein n=1 Tax=Dokdonia sp. R78006 TaxID=3093866 RepID=UPI0026388D43|nr:tryptophan-rich sensory protein [uncultured Dokdonia sp.]
MKKTYAIVNFLSVLLVLAVNGLSQAQRWNNTTIGEASDKYENLFTPAGYAFSIWGVIFLMLLGYSLFQIRRAFFSKKESPFIVQTGWWFAIANFLNAAWVVAFTYDYIGLSVLIMLGILSSLILVISRTNMERWDAPIEVIGLVWWPICIYSGWIAVATIANFSAFFASIGWTGGPLNEVVWTMVMITIAVLINVLMVWMRNMREFALVAVWALVAIFIRHKDLHESIAYYALLGAAVLVVITMLHAFKNKETAPHLKFKERFLDN